MATEKEIKAYRDKLPNEVAVTITRSEEGLSAQIKNFPHCYTQADSFLELVEMVNDAIYTYLDIPEEAQKHVGYYVPSEAFEAIVKDELENAVGSLVKELAKEESNVTNVGETLSVFKISTPA